ncbi:zinc finger CCHC domain-containing protein 8 [Bicyclus anynana]|uniref:Zinc finger CCHC domain-containing protein 8 n=1 Tax=Bicyclus anynana TaxID=110368 RepID=A0A6J1MK24_BICAN|nr:zinc finger CCHC domain-containing protein 8 [Bicyclus anynana]
MAKRKAGLKNIIYELDNDDIELSSDDEAKETKVGRFETDKQKKQLPHVTNKEENVVKTHEIINLDCSSDSICSLISPNNTHIGGKTTETDSNQTSYCQNEINVDDSEIQFKDLQNSTVLFKDHNIVVDSPSNSDLGVVGCENRAPLVTVRFRDRELACKYKKLVREFLIDLLKSQQQQYKNENFNSNGDSDVEIDIWPEELYQEGFGKIEEDCDDFSKDEAVTEFDNISEEDFDKIKKVNDDFSKNEEVTEFDNVSEVDDSMFFVDTAPSDEAHSDIPKYSKNSSLITNIVEEETASPTALRKGPICFNCDGEHPLRDCKLPRNHNKIAASRKNIGPRVGRYHVEDEQKYGHLVPGRISGNLRHALGLMRNELPLHIYRMRLLGYPPGWLEEAKISHSGITLFDSTGNATQDPEEEDGEICQPGSKDKFDIKKILDFPGYNVPASSRYIEESHLFGLPPMSQQDSKMEMLQALAPNAMQAYKRKKLTLFPSANQNSLLEGQAEMELDSGDEIAEFPSIPPLPDEAPPPPPPPPPTPPPDDTPLPVNSDKSNKLPDKSKTTNNSIKKESNKDLVKTKENSTNAKRKFDGNEVDLATSSDDELEVIEVLQVPDIPIPKVDELISIDVDDDKSQLSSGPDSPSLVALEERKRRLLDALIVDDDLSMEYIVLDETFSDNTDNVDTISKAETIDETETEDEGPKEMDKETEMQNISITDSEKCSKIDIDDTLSLSDDSKTVEAKKTEPQKSSIENEDKSTKIEELSVIVEDVNTNVEKSSTSNKAIMNNVVNKSAIVNELKETELEGEKGEVNKESVSKEVNTTDSKTGTVKNTLYGTPVLNVASPFVKLPSDDKFAKDISDVIHFENLPNSTGKFKQISSLLKRVKSEVDRIQDS